MDPTVTGALIALGGTLGGSILSAFWSASQRSRTRDERRQETLRAERRACYAQFVSLADEQLMALEDDWQALMALHSKQAAWVAELERLDPDASAERAALENQLREDRRPLGTMIAELQTDRRLRPKVDAVRAARIEVELVGSTAVARDALTISQKMYEVLGGMSHVESTERVAPLLADIREARLSLLRAAKEDVQLMA